MIAAIIQARTGSSRLPGKILKEVCGKSLLQHMIERVSNSNTLDKIIIATTTKKEDDIIVKFCKEKNLLCYRGSENDVLSRYKFAAEKFNVDTIVRLTSDTPLMHFSIIDEVVRTYINNDYDYVSNGVPLPRTYPDGINVEVFSREILDEMHANAKKPSEREHVTLFVTFQPEKYKIFRVDYKVDASKYRFNLDYDLDYEFLKTVFEKLYFKNNNFSMEDVIKLLEDDPSVFQINSKIKPYEGVIKSFIEDEKQGFTTSTQSYYPSD